MCTAEAGCAWGVLYTRDLANTAVFFLKWLHLQEYRPSALSCVTAASKKRDANIGYHRCLLRTVKVQNSLSFSDPECTEHRSKVSTPRSGRGRSKNTQEWTSTAEAWPPAAFSLDEDILM